MEQEKGMAVMASLLAEQMQKLFTVQPTLTLAQAAEALGVSAEKMRQLCTSGEIPFVRVDKFYRIKPADINRYIDRNYQEAVK